jgi:hypothetical protein
MRNLSQSQKTPIFKRYPASWPEGFLPFPRRQCLVFSLAHHYRLMLAWGLYALRFTKNLLAERMVYSKSGRNNFCIEIVLSCPLRNNLASRRGSFGRFYSAQEAPKPRWERTIYGCGIISANVAGDVSRAKNEQARNTCGRGALDKLTLTVHGDSKSVHVGQAVELSTHPMLDKSMLIEVRGDRYVQAGRIFQKDTPTEKNPGGRPPV